MAARKRARPAPVVDDDFVEDVPLMPARVDDDDDGQREEDDLDLIVEQLTGEAEYVVLWRLDGATGKQEHVDKIVLSRFNADYVKERHGGGDYLMRAYGLRVTGRPRRMAKYKEFSIDKSIPPKSGGAAALWKERNPNAAASEDRRGGLPVWLETMLAASLPVVVGGIVNALTREKIADPLLVELIKTRGVSSGHEINPIELQRLLADERDRAIQVGKDIAGARRPRGDGGENEDAGMWGAVTEGIATLKEFALGYRQHAENEKNGIAPDTAAETAATNPVGILPAGARPMPVDDGSDARGVASGAVATTPLSADGALMRRSWVVAAAPYMGMLNAARGLKPERVAALISESLSDDEFNDLMSDYEDTANGGILVRLPEYFPALGNAPTEWVRAILDAIAATAVPLDEFTNEPAGEPSSAPGDDTHQPAPDAPTSSEGPSNA